MTKIKQIKQKKAGRPPGSKNIHFGVSLRDLNQMFREDAIIAISPALKGLFTNKLQIIDISKNPGEPSIQEAPAVTITDFNKEKIE